MKLHMAGFALLTLAVASCSSQPAVRSQPEPLVPGPAVVAPRVVRACPDCGRVEKIELLQVPVQRTTPRSGAVLGGVVGGVLAAPAKPGAVPATQKITQVSVRLDDGRRVSIRQNVVSPNLRIGSRVRVTGGRVVLLR
jgi:hypothetical protein